MTARADSIALAEARLAEGNILLDAGQWSGAYYVSGYAVELGLKAIVSRRFLAETIPDRKLVAQVHTHDLFSLARLAGLEDELLARRSDPAIATFNANWSTALKWGEDARYRIATEADARALLAALGDRSDGVVQWIRTHW